MLYSLILTALIIFIFVFYFFSGVTKFSKAHAWNLFFTLCIVFLVCLIIFFPEVSYNGASSGVNLWFNVVFPSLLPFIIASEILIGLGFVNFLGTLFQPFMKKVFNVSGAGSFALAMGLTSGYPTGAKITADIYEKNLCTKTEAERLLTFTNNSGPLFIIGAVSVGMFNNPQLGMVLAIAHYTAAITVGILFRWYNVKGHTSNNRNNYSAEECPLNKYNKIFNSNILRSAFREMFDARKNDGRNIGLLIGDAIKNSVNLLLAIGGFIIFFSVIISLLSELNIIYLISSFFSFVLSPFNLDNSIIGAVFAGLFEITTGCKASSLAAATYMQKIIAAAFILGWAGLSVHLQVISIISKTDISAIPYLCAKFLQGIIAAIYTFILFKYIFIFESMPVFNNFTPSRIPWIGYFVISSKILFVVFILLFALTLILYFKQRLNKKCR